MLTTTGLMRTKRLILLVLFGAAAAPAADVNLELRPLRQPASLGDRVTARLVAISADPELAQPLAAMDVLFTWDPAILRLVEIDRAGAPAWLYADFPADPWGINEAFPPQDGSGLFTAFSPLGEPVAADPDGLLVISLRFDVIAVVTETPLAIVPDLAGTGAQTRVYDGVVPNRDITGTLGSCWIEIGASPCFGDLDGDRNITLSDLAVLLANFAVAGPVEPDQGDLDLDGDVDLQDLAFLLSRFGMSC